MDKITNEQRAVFVNNALDSAGITNWGRAGIIKERMSCSPATASGWLTGTLPKDPVALFGFAAEFNFDAHEWVFGVKSSEATSLGQKKVSTLIKKLKEFESDREQNLSPDQFARLFMLLLESEEKASFLMSHADILLKN